MPTGKSFQPTRWTRNWKIEKKCYSKSSLLVTCGCYSVYGYDVYKISRSCYLKQDFFYKTKS